MLKESPADFSATVPASAYSIAPTPTTIQKPHSPQHHSSAETAVTVCQNSGA
jgi:hypothetical protein